jgi:hypothetical protein
MEDKIWRRTHRLVTKLGALGRQKKVQFADTLIVLTYLWSVLHDRPTCWATDEKNWKAETRRPGALPSPTTMSRRLRTVGVRRLLELAEAAAVGWFPRGICYWIDSKPLPVGGVSRDRDAKVGRGAGGLMAKGYRLHLLINAAGAAVKWALAPMNAADAVIGGQLLIEAGEMARTRGLPLGGYLAGDNLYDTNMLHDHAAAIGLQLIAPPRENAKGVGHRRNSPDRLRGLELARDRPIGHDLLESRRGIERVFGTIGNYGGGLGPLPNWVRRPRRVSMWVAGKLLFDTVRRAINQRLAA